MAKNERRQLAIGEHFPNQAEARVVGGATAPIQRGDAGFSGLVACNTGPLVFKDEEGTRSDRMMTARLRGVLLRLGKLVPEAWPDVQLRVTEAWDENHEHGQDSVHYEGRAADLTTSDQDPAKLGRLATLAVRAGGDWVFYENASHIHVSVRR